MEYDRIVQTALSLLLITMGGGAGVRYLLERKRANADGYVAKATSELQIDAVQLRNIAAQMELMKTAWAAERASLQGRVTTLAEELAAERRENQRKEQIIKRLQVEVQSMQEQLDSVTKQLRSIAPPNNPSE